MRYRKLRIAWSVFCGLACVLVIVLWVRSYWWAECVYALDKNLIATNIGSNWGELYIVQIDRKSVDPLMRQPPPHSWRYQVLPAFAQQQKQLASLVRQAGTLHLAIPYWIVILPAAGLAAIPWLSWQFRLRTLLIATTLVAVVLGLAVWAVK